jgi:hypothetical protein
MGPTELDDQVAAWAGSGALSLCGRSGEPPLGPPAALLDLLRASGDRIARASQRAGQRVELDPFAVVAERAAIAGLGRNGPISCGGASRLLPTGDGWVAVTLARADDTDLLPAWLGVDPPHDVEQAWAAVTDVVGGSRAGELVERAAELGLPVAEVGGTTTDDGPPVLATPRGEAAPTPVADAVVVDLSALWAGPLCGRILADAGATVVKVESTRRPDGARSGPPAFFDLMNAGKRSVAVDLPAPAGRAQLARLVRSADVVIEASRPRALEALGIDVGDVLGSGPVVWLSITAYGRSGPGRDRVGFGDDTAAAGGAVLRDATGPCFLADALADPLAGLVSAAGVLEALGSGGRWLLDVGMARVAAAVAGPSLDVNGVAAPPPESPSPRRRAPELGADTADVLSALDR